MNRRIFCAALAALALSSCGSGDGADGKKVELLNVSYDPTRELYSDINAAFAKKWKAEKGQDVSVRMSHGGSGKQSRAVIDGLQADVVTLALGYDIDAIAEKAKSLPADWQTKLPNNSSPYTSTIVFLVRKGNPRHIRDWDDLARPGVKVITPNPKTSGGARWNFLAAWGYGRKTGGSDQAAERFVSQIFRNVPVLDSGARGATTTFAERGLGDVLISWENEAYLALASGGKDKFEIVVPSISILAEPPVAVVEANAKKKGTTEVANAYLNFLYTPEGQKIITRHFYRPRDAAALAASPTKFPQLQLLTIDKDFGGWRNAQKTYFAEGGVFDRIFQGIKR
ncbi:MAG: sulfate ABC transporter substrate-binding protein [Sphingomicrobium sp.]